MMKAMNHVVLAPRAIGTLLRVLVMASGLAVIAPAAHAEISNALVKAVKFNDVREVSKQLRNGEFDPNAVDPKGDPLLVIAAREKSDKVVAALVAAPSIDVNKQNTAGEDALMMAALNGNVELVQLLLGKGAQINKSGWSALHYAAANGHDTVVKLLLDHAAAMDARSPNGTTPLMMAARGNHPATVKLLLERGADPLAKNQLGLTALDFAKQYKAPDTLNVLSQSVPRAQAEAPQS